MKTRFEARTNALILLAIAAFITPSISHAHEMDYVDFSFNLPVVKFLKNQYPVCDTPQITTKMNDGQKDFTIVQHCKTQKPESPNDSVTITITGSSAPWGELGDIEVKVGSFCAGNCEV